MICKDCMHQANCNSMAMHDFDHSHRMWLINFWENAEERCDNFKKVGAAGSEWCVACGAEIPEGRQVCVNCEKKGAKEDAKIY